MVHQGVIVKEGIITEALPNASFRVKLNDEKVVLGYVSGKMRMNRINIMPGDKVKIEITPYDSSKGRIVYKCK